MRIDLNRKHNKTINVWFRRALSDLSALASGLVGKNSALGLRPRALFLPTRPEARADKSDNALGTILQFASWLS